MNSVISLETPPPRAFKRLGPRPGPSDLPRVSPPVDGPNDALRPWPSEMDVRGVRPPHPLAAILVALDAMPPGHPQYVRTRENPAELVEALALRGVHSSVREWPGATWRIVLWRDAPPAG